MEVGASKFRRMGARVEGKGKKRGGVSKLEEWEHVLEAREKKRGGGK